MSRGRPKRTCRPASQHQWVDTEGGRECEVCFTFEGTCTTCRRVPCQCDELFDQYRDRELEKELDGDRLL